ncbi:MAG: DUF2274 domain-containing protein [Alphaproteobacteria bacterium]|nr:DUF2274 domain-containing protein [Alphaproteobacteria bacterium]
MICSSENCFRLIRPSLLRGRTLAPNGGKNGGHVTYAAALAAETGQQPMPPEKLVAPMLARFMDTDRGFRRHRAQGS